MTLVYIYIYIYSYSIYTAIRFLMNFKDIFDIVAWNYPVVDINITLNSEMFVSKI